MAGCPHTPCAQDGLRRVWASGGGQAHAATPTCRITISRHPGIPASRHPGVAELRSCGVAELQCFYAPDQELEAPRCRVIALLHVAAAPSRRFSPTARMVRACRGCRRGMPRAGHGWPALGIPLLQPRWAAYHRAKPLFPNRHETAQIPTGRIPWSSFLRPEQKKQKRGGPASAPSIPRDERDSNGSGAQASLPSPPSTISRRPGDSQSEATKRPISSAPQAKITSPGVRSQISTSMIGRPMNSAERAYQ